MDRDAEAFGHLKGAGPRDVGIKVLHGRLPTWAEPAPVRARCSIETVIMHPIWIVPEGESEEPGGPWDGMVFVQSRPAEDAEWEPCFFVTMPPEEIDSVAEAVASLTAQRTSISFEEAKAIGAGWYGFASAFSGILSLERSERLAQELAQMRTLRQSHDAVLAIQLVGEEDADTFNFRAFCHTWERVAAHAYDELAREILYIDFSLPAVPVALTYARASRSALVVIGFGEASDEVGIFWAIPLRKGKRHRILTETTGLSRAQRSGDLLTHPRDHYEVWTEWQGRTGRDLRQVGLPALTIKNNGYDKFPRGRVVYDKIERQFIIYADRRLHAPEMISQIKKQFRLTPFTVIVRPDDNIVQETSRS